MAIATGAPQVIAMRLARMAAHGPNPSASDRREMHRMVDEKTKAFGDAWMAMGAQSLRMQQAFWQQMWQPLMQPWWLGAGMRAFAWPTTTTKTLGASPFAGFGSRSSRSRQVRSAHASANAMGHNLATVAAAGLAPLSRRVASNVKRLGSRSAKRG